jgi:hypothetical protein
MTEAFIIKEGIKVVEKLVSIGSKSVYKWELYAEEGKCFYDLTIPENYDEEEILRPENERVYYRYMIMPKDEEYVQNNLIVVDYNEDYELVN